MDSLRIRDLVPAVLTVLFFALCLHFAMKADEGPWHRTAKQLWEKEEWHKLRALGKNLHDVGKEDVESFYLAMLASAQLQDAGNEKFFASRLSDSRVLSWKLEKQIAKSYKPEPIQKRVALYRTRMVYAVSIVLLVSLVLSWRRKEPYKLAPALISAVGIAIFLL